MRREYVIMPEITLPRSTEMTAEERSFMGRMLRRMRRSGGEVHKTPKQVECMRKAREISVASRRGDVAEVERLRWLYYPEKMRAKQLAEQMNLENKPK